MPATTGPLIELASGLPGELQADEARWVEAAIDDLHVASAYVPNGRALGTPTFAEKLAFLDAIGRRVEHLAAAGEQIVVAGDLNVTRDDRDVWDSAAFAESTHVTPAERTRLERILEAGDLVDAYRHVHPDDPQFTWWDYRQGHFHRGMGLRIDYALVSRRSLHGSSGAASSETSARAPSRQTTLRSSSSSPEAGAGRRSCSGDGSGGSGRGAQTGP